MLGRYTMKRGVRAASLPVGLRQDTRKHTRHVLRPSAELVARVLAPDADDGEWQRFATAYRALLEQRFAEDRGPFDALAELARTHDVWLGCSCPTAKNPDVRRCHTALALAFMRAHYPELDIRGA
ncbi:MAG: hypothetical protein IAG13_34185 [Deltaproteobacteria bacterium]|nr:hypothetical protein [Nannocystaceae bacterium]